jgi:uncharacterized membrane protein
VDWLLFSLLGAASLAVTGVIDKFILEKYVQNSHTYLIALIVLQQAFAACIFLIMGSGFVFPQSIYAIAVGVIQIAYWAAYLRALKVEETSRIAALVYVYPVFVYPAAFFFLGETLSPRDFVGGLLLVISGLLVSYRPAVKGSSLILSPALKYMLLFWVFYATYSVSAKFLLSFMDEWHLMIWLSLGNLIAVQPFLLSKEVRAETHRYLQSGRLFFSALMVEETFSFFGRGALIFAYAVGSVALVSSVAALQPLLTLVYVLALSIFIPGVLVEELDPRTIYLKLVAVFLIVVGVYLVSG